MSNDNDLTEYLFSHGDVEELNIRQGARKKRRKNKKVAVTLLVFLFLLSSGVAFFYNYLNHIFGNITGGGDILSALFSRSDVELATDEHGRTNILVFGTEGYDMNNPNHDGGYLTDTMMLISIDRKNNDVSAVSLPRDLKVAKTCSTSGLLYSARKLNEVYYCEYQHVDVNDEASRKKYEAEGAARLEESFNEILGVDIQYYVHLNWSALIQVVDAIGGIDAVFTYGDQVWEGDEVAIETTDRRGLKDGIIDYPNGVVVHMDGEHALGVARSRNAFGGYGAARSNFSREYFQQKIIEAIVKKAKQINFFDIATLMKLLNAIGDNVRTDFKDTEIQSLIHLVRDFNFSAINTISLYGEGGGPMLVTTDMIDGISYVVPSQGVGNYKNIHTFVAKQLFENSEMIEEVKITVLNGTGGYGIAAKEQLYLEDNGLKAEQIGNAPDGVVEKDATGVRIYVLNDKAPRAKGKLEALYGVEAILEVPEAIRAEYSDQDFVILLLNGYKDNRDKK